jgi:pimeloyl-ACP methyl ester carboxylesterase
LLKLFYAYPVIGIKLNSSKIYYKNLSPPNNPNLPHIIWGHGWGQTHANLLPIANSLQNFANHWLLDFPGFGASTPPNSTWSSLDYANATANWIANHIPTTATKIWVGHSFGGRVGINLAAKYPNLISGLFLIAASGIPKPRNLTQTIIISTKIKTFKLLKILNKLLNNDKYSDWLKTKFGSPDYRNANTNMRSILIKAVNENLSTVATQIICPTELLYGENDTETPITIGQNFNQLINNSKLHVLPQEDHYSVLSEAKHQVIYLLKQFIYNIKQPC